MKILVTGGAGYIGSHTVVELLKSDYEVIIIDDFSNSSAAVLENIKKITNKNFTFYEGNVCDKDLLNKVFSENSIEAVIHFAGFKAVGESVNLPLKYYNNNLISSICLLEIMKKYGCKKIVFSSTATVYGSPEVLPVKETADLKTTNPYATTKLMIENILRDVYISDNDFSIAVLRYFNPIGADKSGLIGENPNGIPNNLMPYIMKVAKGELEVLNVFGDDYDTHDGTGVRDYIHVVDLANAHIKAIEYIINKKGIDYYNIGTGIGYSVLDIVNTFEKVNNVKIKYKIVERRKGDVDCYYADPSKAYEKLGFKARYNLEDMCRDSYNYIKNK